MPVILYGGLIFYVSSRSSLPDVGPKLPNFDKVVHFSEYTVLGGLFFRAALNSESEWLRLRPFFWAVVFSSLYAMTDEIHQSFVPNRCCDVFDWLADTLGAIFAQCAIWFATSRIRKADTVIFEE